jgi:hypothetical protein
MLDNLDRRQFLQTAGALAAAPLIAAAATPESQKKMIGMQIGAVSFLDEGTEKVLDIAPIFTPSAADA